MNKVAFIAMSCKPFHKGHQMLIDLAAAECDSVEVHVSLSDRENITGGQMKHVWSKVIPTLPNNVRVCLLTKKSPVRNIYEILGDFDKNRCSDQQFVLYGDPHDLEGAFQSSSLNRYLPNLVHNNQVTRRSVSRNETIQLSGTMMREWIKTGEKEKFFEGLPDSLNKESIWAIFQNNVKNI